MLTGALNSAILGPLGFKMADTCPAPSRQRFGGLRRMMRSVRRTGLQPSEAAIKAQTQVGSPSTVESQRDKRQQQQRPPGLDITVVADAATPAAPHWQCRDNSVYSPLEVQGLNRIVSCCKADQTLFSSPVGNQLYHLCQADSCAAIVCHLEGGHLAN